MVKGYELEEERFVILNPEALKALEEGASHLIDIVAFIPATPATSTICACPSFYTASATHQSRMSLQRPKISSPLSTEWLTPTVNAARTATARERSALLAPFLAVSPRLPDPMNRGRSRP